MNTAALARRYSHLTPWERVALVISAADRGDGVECDRLIRTAAQVRYVAPDCHAVATAIRELAFLYLLRQLDLAASNWKSREFEQQLQACGLADAVTLERLSSLRRLRAYRFVVYADGWKLLCAELKIDPEALVRGLPGYELVKEVETEARVLAFRPEEILAYGQKLERRGSRKRGSTGTPSMLHVETAADVARSMRASLEEGAQSRT